MPNVDRPALAGAQLDEDDAPFDLGKDQPLALQLQSMLADPQACMNAFGVEWFRAVARAALAALSGPTEGSEPVAWQDRTYYDEGEDGDRWGAWHQCQKPTDEALKRAKHFGIKREYRALYLATPAAASQDAKDAVMVALEKCRNVAIENGAYESYRAVGKAFDELRAAIASMAGQTK